MSYIISFLGFGKRRSDRAFELDLLRGIAICMMVFMHFSYDVRYEFGISTFSYLVSDWFWAFVHPVILVLFVGVSGVCCSFSRSNVKRGLTLMSFALLFTVTTLIVTYVLGIYCLILFNVLHLLALSTLVYALLDFLCTKSGISRNAGTFIIGLIGIYIIVLNNEIHLYDYSTSNMLFFPIGFRIDDAWPVADYMNIIPWMGVFLTGSALGRSCYAEKKSLFPDAPNAVRKISSPFEFLGRHSLFIYLVHQPVIYGILYIIFLAAGKI